MAPLVIFEDEVLLILSKPAGWITNSAATTGNQQVLQNWVHDNFSFETTKERQLRDGIVHRLDKETSGILIVAKTSESFTNLQDQFKQRKVQKKYTALVHGKVELRQGVVDAPVGRLPWRRDRFGVLLGGRDASTNYKVLRYYKSKETMEEFSLVELAPKTGRTHQIRIHMKHLGHPLVSDEFYAGRKTARKDRKWCPRLFLHAAKIAFTHPGSGERIEFESPLPGDLATALEKVTASS